MIIDHIKDSKKLTIENDYYVIENYICKMGFSRTAFENNRDKYSIEDIKSEILNNACIKYYLVMDISDLNKDELLYVCQKIKNLKIRPKYISFITLNKDPGKVRIIEQAKLDNVEWKIHNFIVDISKMDAFHLSLDTNIRKNNSRLLLFYSPKDIDSLDDDINEINTIVYIDQPGFHVLCKNGKEDEIDGLLISFDAYLHIKGMDKDIIKAISDLEGTIKLFYGTK
jgi:hypothetical protein